MKGPRTRPRDGGMTLVEVLVAMALFLLGITALLGLFHFGGGMETSARAQAELAPAVEPLVRRIRAEVWLLGPGGAIQGLRELKGEVVPGAPDYRYDLQVEPAGADPNLRRASLIFYRKSPDRPVAQARFLLPRQVPVARRLNPSRP